MDAANSELKTKPLDYGLTWSLFVHMWTVLCSSVSKQYGGQRNIT